MTRKDTILIAVVINAGLLAILLATAVIYDTSKEIEQPEFLTTVLENKTSRVEPIAVAMPVQSTGDEVDNVLKYYRPAPSTIAEKESGESFSLQHLAREEEENPLEETVRSQKQIELKVKKGDTLEKIAKAHHSSIEAIKKMNRLENERLSIGQVLKIPVKEGLATSAPTVVVEKKEKKSEFIAKEAEEPVYYTIKSGDNPWKIAKQYNVNYEDIVRLNNLNEEKARNLKIGDRVRVK